MSVHTRVITPGLPIMLLSLICECNQNVHSDTLTPTGGSTVLFMCVLMLCEHAKAPHAEKQSPTIFRERGGEGVRRGEERRDRASMVEMKRYTD